MTCLNHGEMVVVTERVGMIETKRPLGNHDSLPLEPQRLGELLRKLHRLVRLLRGGLSTERRETLVLLLDGLSVERVNGDGVSVVRSGDILVKNGVDRLVEGDSLEHELETGLPVASGEKVLAGFHGLFGGSALNKGEQG